MSRVYILTIKSGDTVTRIQCGCLTEMTMDLLCYADACGTFDSFVKVDDKNLPKRDTDELFRMESFVKLSREFAKRFSRETRTA